MAKLRIAVFAGANATILNSPTLVTSNKGRLPGERVLDEALRPPGPPDAP